MSKSFQFITGATGFVGSALVLELLARTDSTLVCLVRADDSFAAYERLQSALHEAALLYECEQLVPEIFSRCIAITGDLLDPGFVSRLGNELAHFGRARDFWHCAASLEFEESRAREIFLSNFQGTRNVLEIAKRLGAERFLHVSTAYVAGQRCGVIPEAPPLPALGFHNTYEESKATTELMLLDERDMDVYILRPSIVVGHSRTYATTGCTGVYGFMREIYRLQRRFERQNAVMPALRLSGKEESVFSVIPVDLFAREAVDISMSSTRDRIFHVTRRNKTTALENIQIMCEELGLPRPGIAAPGEPLDRVNQMLMSKLSFAKPYMSGYKRFCTKHTDAVTGGAAVEELDSLPYTRWFRDFLVAQDASFPRKTLTAHARVA
jgi:nucleoside-diphosphate-sugar epimerase